MESRFNFFTAAPDAYKAMRGRGEYLHCCGLEENLLHLVKLRASQINGCAYCLDKITHFPTEPRSQSR
jgi:alkylhydroperoxidase family enzyme